MKNQATRIVNLYRRKDQQSGGELFADVRCCSNEVTNVEHSRGARPTREPMRVE